MGRGKWGPREAERRGEVGFFRRVGARAAVKEANWGETRKPPQAGEGEVPVARFSG